MAGNDVSIAAGNNVNIEGTVSQAGRCLSVAATNNLTIQSALSTIDQKTSFQSESASIGVSAGVGLTGFSLAGNASVGFQTGNSSMHQATNVNSQLSGGTVTLKSGRDTTVAGATVTGGTVTADVGGNLSVESRQDTLTSRNSQTGFSLGIGIGLGSVSTTLPGPTSILGQTASFLPDGYTPNTNILSQTGTMLGNAGGFLAGNGNTLTNVGGGNALHNSGSFGFTYVRGSEDKAWTNQLTTLNGVNGLTLSVANNTHVKGAIIESNGGIPLTINTGTFTYENIQDYDKTKNISASVNVTIPLGSVDWQKPAATPAPNGGWQTTVEPANPPAPPSLSMLAQIGQGLGQFSQFLSQYPTKVQVAYKATDKEGTTFATVGQGTINVSDTVKQAALEKAGRTGALDKLNRDVTKTQVITKNKVDAFNLYVSTEAIKTVAAITEKAVDYISKLLADGKILNANEVDLNELQKRGVKLGDISVCVPADGGGGGGNNSGFLFNLFITPAYAGDNPVPCIVRFNGAEALSKNGVVMSDTDRKQMANDLANTEWQKVLDDQKALAAVDPADKAAYTRISDDLQIHLGYFAMCATDDRWNHSVADYFSQPQFAAYVAVAQDYKLSAEAWAKKYDNYANLKAEAILDLKQSNPALYNALIRADYEKADPQIMDVAFQLSGMGQNKNASPELHQYTLNYVANLISGLTIQRQSTEGLPEGVGAVPNSPAGTWRSVAYQANALSLAVDGLSDADKSYLNDAIKEKYSTYIQTQLAQAQGALQERVTSASTAQTQAAYHAGAAYSAALAMSLLSGDKSYLDLVLDKSQVLPAGTVARYGELVDLAKAILDGHGGTPIGFDLTQKFVGALGYLKGSDHDLEAREIDSKNREPVLASEKLELESSAMLNAVLTASSLGANVARQKLAEGASKVEELVNPPASKPSITAAEAEGTAPIKLLEGPPQVGGPKAVLDMEFDANLNSWVYRPRSSNSLPAVVEGAPQVNPWGVQTGSGTVLVALPPGYRPATGSLSSAGSSADGVIRVVGPNGEFRYLQLPDEPMVTFYRTMKETHWDKLESTGIMPWSNKETMISPSLEYVQQYTGVTVEFNLPASTIDRLLVIGVRNEASQMIELGYGNLPLVQPGWKNTNAFFKFEDPNVNIGLGRGDAIQIFNEALQSGNYRKVPK